MPSYKVTVTRGKSSSTLTYAGSISVTTTCWWDPDKKIPKGTYSGCSATTMATKMNSEGKPREAIFIPNVLGFKGIFIHKGTSAAWSDGCVVIAEPEIKRIYNDIDPKDGKNVTVTIIDI
jgi:hypothetical protein